MTGIDLLPRFLPSASSALGVSAIEVDSEISTEVVANVAVGVAVTSTRGGLPRPRPEPGVAGDLGVAPPRPLPPPRFPPGFFQVQILWTHACFFWPLPG